MSATFDDDTPRDVFAEGPRQQQVDMLAEWLLKLPPGSSVSETVEFLALHYLFYIAALRRGVDGLSTTLANANEIAKVMGKKG